VIPHPVVEVADGEVASQDVDEHSPVGAGFVDLSGVQHRAQAVALRVHHVKGARIIGHSRDVATAVG
jgi:hypothetical protein